MTKSSVLKTSEQVFQSIKTSSLSDRTKKNNATVYPKNPVGKHRNGSSLTAHGPRGLIIIKALLFSTHPA